MLAKRQLTLNSRSAREPVSKSQEGVEYVVPPNQVQGSRGNDSNNGHDTSRMQGVKGIANTDEGEHSANADKHSDKEEPGSEKEGEASSKRYPSEFGLIEKLKADASQFTEGISRLEQLPIEVLEQVTWLSYNPELPSVSWTLAYKLPVCRDLRYDMIMHACNGWAAAHKAPKMLQFRTSSARHAEVLSRESMVGLQRMLLDESWFTLKALKSAGTHVMETWIRTNWNMKWCSNRKTTESLSELFEDPDLDTFRIGISYIEDWERYLILTIAGGSVEIQKFGYFWGYEDDEDDEDENEEEGADGAEDDNENKVKDANKTVYGAAQSAQLIELGARPEWILKPPVKWREDNTDTYDSWVQATCNWFAVQNCFGCCQSYDTDLLMLCIRIAIENGSTEWLQYCLMAHGYHIDRYEDGCHSFDILHDGFLLRTKDLCVKFGRFYYVWKIISYAHGRGGIPRGWFSEEDVKGILIARDYTSKDGEAMELARHFRPHAMRASCGCKGRIFDD